MCWLRLSLAIVLLTCSVASAPAAVFRWDNNALIPGTAGITPRPGVNFSGWNSDSRNLQFARFTGDLSNANFGSSWLQSVSFSQANLTNANLQNADLSNAHFGLTTLANANLTGAAVSGVSFSGVTSRGFTKEQFYSTVSYQLQDLHGVTFEGNDLTGWNFREQNLTQAQFRNSTLASADFTDATITNATLTDVTSRGFTKEQFYSTANYQQQNLQGVRLRDNDISSWNFSGQDLTNADFASSNLANADFAGATITGATFDRALGLTSEQFYSTASYHQKNLQGLWLAELDFTAWDFSGQDLTGSHFGSSTLTDANLTDAIITDAYFGGLLAGGVPAGGLTRAQLYSTRSYQQKYLRGLALYEHDLSDADFSGQDLTNSAFIASNLNNANFAGAIVTGASFAESTGFTREQLYSTDSYQAKHLQGIGLYRGNVAGWDFREQNLTQTSFSNTDVTDANFAGAQIAGAVFEGAVGFTEEQLYSTASYQQKDLRGFSVSHNDVSGWDFSGQNLTNADFDDAIYIDTNLAFADTRGGQFFELWMPILRNTIEPDGTVAGLDLNDGERLVVGDYDGFSIEFSSFSIPAYPVHIHDHMTMSDGGVLQLVFEGDEWNSTISFDSDIPVELAGVLELDFAADVDVSSQVGLTFAAFDWTGVTATGEFRIESPYVWDTSKLYTTGELTLTAVPEPVGVLLLLSAMPLPFAARSLRGRLR